MEERTPSPANTSSNNGAAAPQNPLDEDDASGLLRETLNSQFQEKHALAEASYQRMAAVNSGQAVGDSKPAAATETLHQLAPAPPVQRGEMSAGTMAASLATSIDLGVTKAKMENDPGIAKVEGKATRLEKVDTTRLCTTMVPSIPEDTAKGGDGDRFSSQPLPQTRLGRTVAIEARRDAGAFRVSANSGNITPGESFHSGLLQQLSTSLEPLQIYDDAPQTATKEGNLAVAEEVVEEGAAPHDLPQAEELRSKEPPKTKTMIWGGVVIVGLVALVIFLIVFFVVRGTDKSASASGTVGTTSNSTEPPAPILSPEEILVGLLPAYTLPKLDLEFTAQSRAFQFLVQDPNFDFYSEKRLLQRFALATFYYATNGEDWDEGNTTWINQTLHECQWETFMPYGQQYTDGFDYRHTLYKFIDTPCFVPNATHPNIFPNATSSTDDDDITCLAMFERKLTGVLPPELALLTSLKLLHFESTTLEGTIPTLLFDMPSLEEVHLTNTVFEDTIPTEFTKLSNLRLLQITGESYFGTLPTELGIFSNMVDFKITDTRIGGTFPVEYVNMQPKDLQLNNNFLSGTLPTELGQLSLVEWFMLDKNGFVRLPLFVA